MKTKLTGFIVAAFLLINISMAFAAEKLVQVGTQADNVGTSYINEKGVLTGFEVEVLREIDQRLPDYAFEYKTMDFATLFIALGSKKLDLITSNIQWSAEREKKYLFTKETFYSTPYKLVVKESENSIKSFRDLTGKKVGLLGTGLQAKVFADYVERGKLEVEVVPGKSNTELVSLLFADRVDALVLPEHQAVVFKKYRDRALKTVGKGLIPLNLTVSEVGAHFLTGKEDVALRDRLDWALQSLRKDGTLSRLSIEWFGQDFTVPFDVEEVGK
ncbi:cysteine ABC transporter substrate-binding protein [Deltaproteobacteria bacterium]|nr:cysteine ABC transporter substrate-binding protein [Deltaproteobacteria bacterium]